MGGRVNLVVDAPSRAETGFSCMAGTGGEGETGEEMEEEKTEGGRNVEGSSKRRGDRRPLEGRTSDTETGGGDTEAGPTEQQRGGV